MGYIKIWVHLVWTTKNRKPLLNDSIRGIIFDHIRKNAMEKGIYLDFINGYREHVHCLVSLGPGQDVDKILMLLKGESSRWINQNSLVSGHFGWQDEYFAVSISESSVNRVRNYIRKQEDHHKRRSFEEEYQQFLKRYDFDRFVSGYSPGSAGFFPPPA
ncbi:MAG TPA: IS200/IS605 family transposase [Bacteroidales bacterium]|nr:IS200/IS605 family transposase [Bacteroidales bacterium]HPS62447.1 IS200/IS605 family transposase [Bacteroidales bacterium]